MVSTRGLKLKFYENERVLCYEPDPTKAKVLYDSKVLDIVINKDHRGRKTVEYLIHFQGWNSSWDRCVSEEYVLKDTPENRQLQRDLAEKSQLQLGAYLYRRERKKHGRKTSEPIAPSSEDGSSGSPMRMDTDDGRDGSTSSEDSSADEEIIPIELTQDLKDVLEQDYFLMKNKNKVLKLPTEPTIVAILEMYWKHYATNQIMSLNEKPNNRFRNPYQNQIKRQPEDVQRKEVLDGIRVYFDFVLPDLLLYNNEKGQIQTGPAVFSPKSMHIKQEVTSKYELENLPNNVNDEDYTSYNRRNTRRQTLRSSNRNNETHANGNSHPVNNHKASSSLPPNSSDLISKTLSWRLLPDYIYAQQPPPPCLVYGAVHLMRLLVKLPELLNTTSMDDNRLKNLLQHLDLVVDFLNDHKEWFDEKQYIDG